MRIAILAASDSWYLQDLRRAARNRHQLDELAFSQLASTWDGRSLSVTIAGVNLTDYDAVLVRTMPPGSLEQVVFRMDALARLEQAGVVVVNPPRSIETAVDKYLASSQLLDARLPTPRTAVCQSVAEALAAFEQLGGDVVVKPLFGGEGRGILRVSDESLALRTFKTLHQLRAVLYLQEFIPHEGFDIRLLVLGEQVFCMRRINEDDWRTNVSRGARCEAHTADESLIRLARAAADAVGASLAGVDILPGRDGRLHVLEVNAVPGWKALASALRMDIASQVLDHLECRISNKECRV